jgi:hypothetical protein
MTYLGQLTTSLVEDEVREVLETRKDVSSSRIEETGGFKLLLVPRRPFPVTWIKRERQNDKMSLSRILETKNTIKKTCRHFLL